MNDPDFDRTYPDKSFWAIKSDGKTNGAGWNARAAVLDLMQMPLGAIRTDPGRGEILGRRMVRVPGFLDFDPDKDMRSVEGCNVLAPNSTTNIPYALALLAFVDRATDKWMDDRKLSDADRTAVRGELRNCPDPHGPSYRARPLDGVWATAPYLHNGAVPSLYWLLRPAAERPASFCQGARDYDPKQVGFAVPASGETSCKAGQTLFATKDDSGKPIRGNSVLGHSFEGPARPNNDYPPGTVGGAFSEEERADLIEYLKTL